MIKFKKGSKVPFSEKIFEQFEVFENRIDANVSVENVEIMFREFIITHEEPLFLILELPTNEKDEIKSADGKIEVFHKDVYYLDGCSQDVAIDILNKYGELLINDGLSTFGFGGHYSNDEILFGKYNIMTVFSEKINRYVGFFEKYKLEQVDSLITAWDTFSQNNSGHSKTISILGKDIYEIPKLLKERGMYFAERRAE